MKLYMLKHVLTGLLLMAPHAYVQVVPSTLFLNPTVSTSAVVDDADDPAIWVHPTDPARSITIGTDKSNFPNGGLFVWNMNGTLHQRPNINHPNNVDVRYGMRLQTGLVDIAAVSMRNHDKLSNVPTELGTIALGSPLYESSSSANMNIAYLSADFGVMPFKRQAR